MTYSLDHYNALKASLYREQDRLANAATLGEKAFRQSQIDSKLKEIAGEVEFLKSKGIDVPDDSSDDASLLDELFS